MKPFIRIVSPRPNGFKLPEYALKSQEAILACPDWDSEVVEPEGSEIPVLRNTGVTAAEVKGSFRHVDRNTVSRSLDYVGYTHVLQVDPDIEYTVEDVARLLARNVDVVSAAYEFRLKPSCYTAGLWAKDAPELRGMIIPDLAINKESKGLIRCHWVGAGMKLTKKRVYVGSDWPYYRTAVREYTSQDARRAFYMSEDAGFCLNASGHGYGVFLDAETVVKHHIGEETVDNVVE